MSSQPSTSKYLSFFLKRYKLCTYLFSSVYWHTLPQVHQSLQTCWAISHSKVMLPFANINPNFPIDNQNYNYKVAIIWLETFYLLLAKKTLTLFEEDSVSCCEYVIVL